MSTIQPNQGPQPVRPVAASSNPQAMAAQAQAGGDEAEAYEEEYHGGNRFLMFAAVPSWLVSLVVHAVLLLVLGVLTFGAPEKKQNVLTIGNQPEETEEIEEFEQEKIEQIEVDTTEITDQPVVEQQLEVPEEVTDVAVATDVDAAPANIELSDFGETTAPRNDLMSEIGTVTGTGLEGRGAAARGKMIAKYGGSKGSEEAVALALAWLAEHQMPDGGWSFDHRAGRCQGRCPNHGSATQARNGATAMALLPFLGAGQTHTEGKYKEVVRRGLYFLTSHMKADGSLHEAEGSMYSHGLCSIVLCEAYAMTHDKGLMAPAQASINFIVYAQDPVGGGWRYAPKQAGDTSVVGWQLMALKSAHMAYLQVPPETIRGAIKFLDSVQQDSGSQYGYTAPGAGRATTAVGLLCRMYLGWKHENGTLERGVEFLSGMGPSEGNMYYNYYATQVMRQFEGEPWKKWNAVMRDQLVNSQNKSGHMKGSWHIKGDHGSERGGRLYCTAMAAMVLEVYYRHMPIYTGGAVKEDFPL